jgi:predicted DNA-binding protein (UPF0251 family)
MFIIQEENMPRPKKCRRVANMPERTYFKPAGMPLRSLKEVNISFEETEAVRLKDLEGLDQESGAKRMNVSRPTFQRILSSARAKMADAILNGKAIRIEGGDFEMMWHRFRCRGGHEWELENPVVEPPEACPTCSTTDVEPLMSESTRF